MKKRVLSVISKLTIGGAEKVARDIGFYADSEEFETHYLVFGEKKGDYEDELTAHGCKIIRIPEPSENYAAYFNNLKKLINEYHYDIIHAHTMFNIGWAMLAGKLCKVPVRVAHSHSALAEKRDFKTRVYESLMRFLIKTCATDFVACGKKAGERLYGKRFFNKKGTLILNGIDVKSFRFDEEKRKEIREKLNIGEKFVIGHAGHLASVKNQGFLIEIMPETLKKKPESVLLLLGDGEERENYEKKVSELNLEDKVIFTGNVRNVGDCLSAMDVFAFPSLYEGTPLSVIEVQSNGLPCVISDSVPNDVFLTELIKPLSLSKKADWVDEICKAKRKNPKAYTAIMEKSPFDLYSALNRFYKIYRGE